MSRRILGSHSPWSCACSWAGNDGAQVIGTHIALDVIGGLPGVHFGLSLPGAAALAATLRHRLHNHKGNDVLPCTRSFAPPMVYPV